MEPPLKFLVVQQKMIGDVLASTVICESLKHHFPEAIVHMVANENTLPVLENNPFLDDTIVFKKEYRDSKVAFYRFLKELKTNYYTAVIDAYGKLESNLISLFAHADKKISNHKWYSSWAYTHTIKQKLVADGGLPLSIFNRLMLLQPIASGTKYTTHPKIYLSQSELEKGIDTVARLKDYETRKVIMVAILGSSPGKTYPARYMAKILNIISDRYDAKIVFNYVPTQKAEVLEIYGLCTTDTQKNIDINFYADSLRDYMVIVSQCDIIIGNEGGAVNIAKALEIPSFSIFSPFIPKGNWHGTIYGNHDAVHLRDYVPALFKKVEKKQLRKQSIELYQKFKPEFFEERLRVFLKNNLT